jgi:hypothetical protein
METEGALMVVALVMMMAMNASSLGVATVMNASSLGEPEPLNFHF